MRKLFLVFAVVAGFAANSFGQASVSATATAAATIVTPLAIANSANLNFGNLATNGTAGTVVITPAAGRSTTGGVTLPATTGTVSAAAFTVTGQAGYTYAITLPAGATTIDDNAGHSMTVDTWTSTPTPTGTLTGGTETLYIGATLNVGASQVAGAYLSDTPFQVTVVYN
jgi:hypothetical protein